MFSVGIAHPFLQQLKGVFAANRHEGRTSLFQEKVLRRVTKR